MRSTLWCLVMFACGPAKPPATERAAPAMPAPQPAAVASPPAGPWLTVTPDGAVRVVHPGRWSCDGGGRTFRVGKRTECILPIDFLSSYQVFGCPDVVQHGGEIEHATYDAHGRLLTYGPRPDYRTEYTYGDGDVPLTINGRKVTVTRDGASVTWNEDGVVTSFMLDAQDRPVASNGAARVTLAWSGDDLAIVDWHMAGLDDVRDVFQACSGTRPAMPASATAPTGGTIRVVDHQAFDSTSVSVAHVVRALDGEPFADIRGCYRSVLDRDPNATGRLALSFTIGPAGRLVQRTVKSFDAAFDRCIEATMQGWRFPTPMADGEATEASFQIVLQISPG